MIQYKSKSEIEMIRKSGQIIARVFEEVRSMIKPGISTMKINNIAKAVIYEAGATPSFLNYGKPPFPGAICSSVNDEVVHGIPSRKRILYEGDIISVDVGAFLDGYHSDAARTFPVGRISADVRKLIDVTEECFWIGFEKVRIGNRLGDVSSAIEEHALKYGYGIVRELTGHGIGKQLHEDPDVPNYGRAGRGQRIEEGLVIAIEPMINLGTRNIRIKKDEWTIVTLDGKQSAHYENTIVATLNGPMILTALQ